jgi:predicted Rossmann fold flavoprotein
MNKYDIIIIGAGAAGLMAAATAVARGKQVLVLEMANTPARKVMISGGGNCNITNTNATFNRYVGKNPQFTRGALATVTPADILNWANKNKLKPFEKTSGRYFCAAGANAVVNALINNVKGANILYNTPVTQVIKQQDIFTVLTPRSTFTANAVIVATGGISFDSVGVSDIGYKIAKDFGHKIIPVRPALCAIATSQTPNDLSGMSVNVQISVEKHKIQDDLLFTHFGIGGPAVYRASLFDMSDGFYIDFIPNTNIANIIYEAKQKNGRIKTTTFISQYLPIRLAKWLTNNNTQNIADLNKADIQGIANKIHNFYINNSDIQMHNMKSAEVVRGGISTDDISSKTMESKICKNLFFVGEVLDITGDLGGFNLHWAWASGIIAGQNA